MQRGTQAIGNLRVMTQPRAKRPSWTELPPSDWAERQAHRIALEINRLRGSRSAQWLADRTRELGYEVSRSVISDLENGRRRYVTTAELITLAAALNTSPVVLVYPGPYQNKVEILPGRHAGEFNAAEWFSGTYSYLGNDEPGPAEDPAEQWRANTETLHQWRHLDELMATRDEMDNPEHIAVLNRQIKAICERLRITIPTDEVALHGVNEKPTDEADYA